MGITHFVVKDHDGTPTLIARWPAAMPGCRKPILLMAHLDVVEAKASDWRNPPFELREKDGYYLGYGTSDDKGSLAGVLLALQGLERAGFQPTRDIVVRALKALEAHRFQPMLNDATRGYYSHVAAHDGGRCGES